ncbi:MAG TPA: tetratricopeptide repeat protein [Thermodesulfobacteriota bacterium]|nr:tetratricopeptide repeat protein [Thermodesulfobacteriota bacterium]
MKILAVCLIISFLALSCATKQVEETAKPTNQAGIQNVSDKKALAIAAFYRGNHKQAIDEIEEAKKINKNDPEIYDIEGSIYLSLKQYDQAESSYKKAIELNSNFSRARHNLCGLYLMFGKWDAAIEQCSKAASDIFSEFRENDLTSLGVAYFKKGDIDKAKEYYLKALEIKPAFPYTHNELGKLYMSIGKDLEAIEEFRKAINGFDRYDEAHYNLALAYLRTGKREAACESFKKVVEISPESALGVDAKGYLSSLCVNNFSGGE